MSTLGQITAFDGHSWFNGSFDSVELQMGLFHGIMRSVLLRLLRTAVPGSHDSQAYRPPRTLVLCQLDAGTSWIMAAVSSR